jgi:hypothetical protein
LGRAADGSLAWETRGLIVPAEDLVATTALRMADHPTVTDIDRPPGHQIPRASNCQQRRRHRKHNGQN